MVYTSMSVRAIIQSPALVGYLPVQTHTSYINLRLYILQGLYTEVTGPTLIDLKLRTNADYEQVAVAVSGRSVGYFIGSAIGGVLVDKFDRYCDLMIALCLNGGAIATVIAPWSTVVGVLWFLIVLQGTFEGVINIGITVYHFNQSQTANRFRPLSARQ